MKNYMDQLRAQMTARQTAAKFPSNRVTTLANQINTWHETRSVPERWQPVMLGRIAALFGISRELAATGLHYAGWKENRIGAASLWQPTINFKNKEQ